jgi:hypothetical protein
VHRRRRRLAAKSARARSVGEPPHRAWIRRQQFSTVPVWTLTAPDLSRALAMKRTASILLGVTAPADRHSPVEL